VSSRLALVLLLVLAAAPAPPAAPPYTRARMEEALGESGGWRFVYGTRDPAAAEGLRLRALALARRLFDADSSQVLPDTAASESLLARGPLVLLGLPRENLWTARWASWLPVRFSPRGFQWFGTNYEGPGDALHLVYPHPLDPRRFLLLLAGNSPGALSRRGGGFYFGDEDYRIYREGELVRSGRFAQDPSSPWRYDPAQDRDREAEARRFEQGLVETRTAAGVVGAPRELISDGTVARVRARLEELAARWGPLAPGFRVVLYPSLELKGELSGNTRPEHLADGGSAARVGLRAGRATPDLWVVGAATLARSGVGVEWAEAAGVWMASAYDGEPLAVAVARLWYGGLWLEPGAAVQRSETWRSPRRLVPARAVLCGALLRVGGRSALERGLRAGAGRLDSLARAARLSPVGLAAVYRSLADSLARAGATRERASGPSQQGGAPFERGVSLVHSVDLRRGYLSAAAGQSLGQLRALDANAVSLTAFAYLPSLSTPELHPSAEGGPDEETDEAVSEAAVRAHALGLRVRLDPHLWTRGWVGVLDFGSAAGWRQFFGAYREWILHQALLAQRYRLETLCMGHELKSATVGHDAEWRALVASVRSVYRGTLTYGANWDEVEQVGFWDVLDQIGVTFYYPLADAPTRDPRRLRAGADRALLRLEVLSRRWRKPVMLVEAGYPARREAPVRPWEEGPGPADPELQHLCVQALTQALEERSFVAGVYWWKWFSDPGAGGPRDASFSVQGKPASGAIEAAFRRWESRAVRVPG
jgi:hypothetical protein